jgi:hypothetical protein
MISWSLKPWKPIKQAKWASFSALKIDKKFGKNPVKTDWSYFKYDACLKRIKSEQYFHEKYLFNGNFI